MSTPPPEDDRPEEPALPSWAIPPPGSTGGPAAPSPLLQRSRKLSPGEGRAVLLGMVASNALAAALMALAKALVAVSPNTSGVLVAALFLAIPLLMGLLCARLWRPAGRGAGAYALWTVANTALSLAVSALFVQEGVVCLIIVAPLVYTFMFAGALIGLYLFPPDLYGDEGEGTPRQPPRMLRASIVPVLLVLLAADCLAPHRHDAVVTTRRVIHAPPAEVWRHVAAFPAIPEKPTFWLNRAGLPAPLYTSVDGSGVGAGRRCVFEGGYVFEERVTEWEPGRRITFDITRQPAHPEILGHALLRRGQMVLTDNGDGTTTITGRSWYSLHVYPAWYYDLWAQRIGHAVHERVFDHIARLSEQGASGH
jgi:uncharacterized protein YndB with AHSA1/START domain